MKAFISAIFGNDGWIKLVEARWLRKRQGLHEAEYDPRDVRVYVKGGYNPLVPRQLVDELPTHGSDQFGGFHSRSDYEHLQPASNMVLESLAMRARPRMARIVNKRASQEILPKRVTQVTLARQALRGNLALNQAARRRNASQDKIESTVSLPVIN